MFNMLHHQRGGTGRKAIRSRTVPKHRTHSQTLIGDNHPDGEGLKDSDAGVLEVTSAKSWTPDRILSLTALHLPHRI